MDFKVVCKYLRVSPRKARPLARELRGLEVTRAMQTVRFVHRGISDQIYKALKSAKANAAVVNPDIKDLYVKNVTVDSGPTLKRWHPVSRGRANRILKRTCHLCVIISDEPVVAGGKR